MGYRLAELSINREVETQNGGMSRWVCVLVDMASLFLKRYYWIVRKYALVDIMEAGRGWSC